MHVHTRRGVSHARGYMLIARAAKFTRLHSRKERECSLRETRAVLGRDDTTSILRRRRRCSNGVKKYYGNFSETSTQWQIVASVSGGMN